MRDLVGGRGTGEQVALGEIATELAATARLITAAAAIMVTVFFSFVSPAERRRGSGWSREASTRMARRSRCSPVGSPVCSGCAGRPLQPLSGRLVKRYLSGSHPYFSCAFEGPRLTQPWV